MEDKHSTSDHIFTIRNIIEKTLRYNKEVYNQVTEKFRTTKGVRQRGSIGQLLFIIFLDEIIKKVANKNKNMLVGSLHISV